MDASMMKYAKHYMKQWELDESRLHEGLKSDIKSRRLTALCNSASYFKVIRNLQTRFDEGLGLPRLGPALDALERISSDKVTAASVFDLVEETRRHIAAAYGNVDQLSFTTKMLWLQHRSPFVIYDSKARSALRVGAGNYREYLARWREGYQKQGAAIDEVCTTLGQSINLGQSSGTHGRSSGSFVVKQQWFKDRVFDMFLWHQG